MAEWIDTVNVHTYTDHTSAVAEQTRSRHDQICAIHPPMSVTQECYGQFAACKCSSGMSHIGVSNAQTLTSFRYTLNSTEYIHT
jgi:hypothetical protein